MLLFRLVFKAKLTSYLLTKISYFMGMFHKRDKNDRKERIKLMFENCSVQ